MLARVPLKKDFFESRIFLRGVIFCFGILVFCVMLKKRLLAPKRPVSKGNRGSFRFRFREAIPRNPANRNIKRAQSLLFLSE